MKSLFGSGFDLSGNLFDKAAAAAASQTDAKAALDRLAPDAKIEDLLAILNMTIINFATGSAELPDSVLDILKNAAARLKQMPAGTTVEVAGYTDNTGEPARNATLSEQRAAAVRRFLIEAGVNDGALTAKGYGAEDPAASNETDEGRYRNRRIEYRLGK